MGFLALVAGATFSAYGWVEAAMNLFSSLGGAAMFMIYTKGMEKAMVGHGDGESYVPFSTLCV